MVMEPFFNCLKNNHSHWFHFLRFDPFLLWLRFYPRPQQNGNPINPYIEAYLFNIHDGQNYYIKEESKHKFVEKVRNGVKWRNNGVLYRSGMMGAIAHLSWDFNFLSELKDSFYLRGGWLARLLGREQFWIFISGNPYNGSITFRDQNYFIQQDTRSLAGICYSSAKPKPRAWGFYISPTENIRLQFIAYVQRGQKIIAFDFYRNLKDQGSETARSCACPQFLWNKNEIEFEFNSEKSHVKALFKNRDDYWVKAEGSAENPQNYCFYPFIEIHLENCQTGERQSIHNTPSDLAFLEVDGVTL